MRPKGTTIQLEVRRRVAVTQHAAAGLDAKPHPGGSQQTLGPAQPVLLRSLFAIS
jgi:hypothetical protein